MDKYSHAIGTERTPDGRRVTVSRVVDAPGDVLWDLLTDTERWAEWGPSVSEVEAPHRYIEDGTRGRVRVAGAWLPFVVDSCERTEGTGRWTWRVAHVPATGHRVEDVGEQCRVTFEIPPLAAGYAVVCRRALATLARLVDDARE